MTNLFPPNTKIKDYGYPESHPFHLGNYPLRSNSSNSSLCLSSSSSSEEEEEEEELENQLQDHNSYHNNTHNNNNNNNSNELYNNGEYYDQSNELMNNIITPDEINCKARAIFDFNAENDNEISLIEGQIIWISYRHGQGWLVAEDPENGENGLVPEEYVEIIRDIELGVGINGDQDDEDVPKRFMSEIFGDDDDVNTRQTEEEDSEWVDTDEEEEEEKEQQHQREGEEEEISMKLKNVEI